MNKKMITGLVIGMMCFGLITAAWMPIHGDINFHTDIARDFLLIKDVLTNKRPTLIGPRAGGIPGVFYGPLWLYLNLPVYYLTGGDPVMTGWFWVSLFGLGCLAFYIILKRLWSSETAGMGVLLYATILAPFVSNSIAHFGAVLLSPLWFYLLIRYQKSNKFLYLVSSYFVIGIVGHFQVAFAGPMVVLQTLWLIYYLYKQKHLWHLVAIFILLLPLATFILFEMRHELLQTKAVIAFIRGSEIEEKFNLYKNIRERFNLMVSVGFGLLPKPWAYVIPMLLGIYLYWKRKSKDWKNNQVFKLYAYFYLGFWVIFTMFKGAVWSYYFWPFMPLSIMALMSLYKSINKRWFYLIVSLIFVVTLWGNFRWLREMQSFMGINNGSWKFHSELAKSIFMQAPGEFGYFVYTPDQYGYSPKYAMSYIQQQFPNISAKPYEKRPTTIIIMAPDSKDNPYTSAEYFVKEKVRIKSEPVSVEELPNGYRIAIFQLEKTEIETEIDSTIVSGIYFR